MNIGDTHETARFGKVEIIEIIDSTYKKVKFLNTGSFTIAQASHIRRGSVKDKYSPDVMGVGFIGSANWKDNKRAHKTWSHMIERCYSKKYHVKQPTYKGCSICEDWHNFTNFLSWYDENYPTDGKTYQLDKDILVQGNKVYSPETCCFVLPRDNSGKAHALMWEVKKGDRVEVITNLAKFSRKENLTHSAMHLVAAGKRTHHKGWVCRKVTLSELGLQ